MPGIKPEKISLKLKNQFGERKTKKEESQQHSTGEGPDTDDISCVSYLWHDSRRGEVTSIM